MASKRCVIGQECDQHAGVVHGREAEELRDGITKIIEGEAPHLYFDGSTSPDEAAERAREDIVKRLQELLDEVDARDSLAFVESQDAPKGKAKTKTPKSV